MENKNLSPATQVSIIASIDILSHPCIRHTTDSPSKPVLTVASAVIAGIYAKISLLEAFMVSKNSAHLNGRERPCGHKAAGPMTSQMPASKMDFLFRDLSPAFSNSSSFLIFVLFLFLLLLLFFF